MWFMINPSQSNWMISMSSLPPIFLFIWCYAISPIPHYHCLSFVMSSFIFSSHCNIITAITATSTHTILKYSYWEIPFHHYVNALICWIKERQSRVGQQWIKSHSASHYFDGRALIVYSSHCHSLHTFSPHLYFSPPSSLNSPLFLFYLFLHLAYSS